MSFFMSSIAAGRLEVEAAGVEADALADHRDLGCRRVAPAEIQQARRLRPGSADRVDRAVTGRKQRRANDLHQLRAVPAGQRGRLAGELLRTHVRGRGVHQVSSQCIRLASPAHEADVRPLRRGQRDRAQRCRPRRAIPVEAIAAQEPAKQRPGCGLGRQRRCQVPLPLRQPLGQRSEQAWGQGGGSRGSTEAKSGARQGPVRARQQQHALAFRVEARLTHPGCRRRWQRGAPALQLTFANQPDGPRRRAALEREVFCHVP
jgi:hypothetical protein